MFLTAGMGARQQVFVARCTCSCLKLDPTAATEASEAPLQLGKCEDTIFRPDSTPVPPLHL